MEPDGSGWLHVSNQRALFVGGRGAKEIPLPKIASLEAFDDGIKIAQVNKPVAYFVTGNPLLGIVLPRIASGNVAASPEA